MVAVLDDFVVQVGAGREAGGTDFTDDLFLLYELALANHDLAQVRVAGAVAIGVDDFDQLAVAAFVTGVRNLPSGRSPH